MKQLIKVIWPWPTWPFTLTHVTFEFFSSELLSSDFWYSHRQTDRWTDWQTDRRKATYKSPLCISTGGLKNWHVSFFFVLQHALKLPSKHVQLRWTYFWGTAILNNTKKIGMAFHLKIYKMCETEMRLPESWLWVFLCECFPAPTPWWMRCQNPVFSH